MTIQLHKQKDVESFPIHAKIDLIYKELFKTRKHYHAEVNSVLKYYTVKENFILRI